MPDPVSRVADPAQDAEVSRELLAQMDEAATSREHWKILLTSGMGFFTDAYDLFIIGVAATMIVSEWHVASYQKSLLTSLVLWSPRTPGAFIGTYALTALLPAVGLGKVSALVAVVSVLGLLVTVTLLPEPKGPSLEQLTFSHGAVAQCAR